jgi:nicotinamide-nucleotide adenylyltransferase
MKSEKIFNVVGIIGRFKPLHIGSEMLLRTACKKAKHVIIGIGSSNKYNSRNPFTFEETKEMVELILESFNNYEVLAVPDSAQIPEFADGKKWASDVKQMFGKLDCFVTGNPFVIDLLKDTYKILSPEELLSPEKRIDIKATKIRLAIVKNESWKDYVPKQVARYIISNKLDDRIRKEFGKEVLESERNYHSKERLDREIQNTRMR